MSQDCGAGAGPVGGSSGNRISLIPRRRDLIFLLALGLSVQGLVLSARAGTVAEVSRTEDVPRAPAAPPAEVRLAERDSLLSEIRIYSEMISALKDSLTGQGGVLAITPARREMIEQSVDDLTGAIDRVAKQLARMELQIKDNRISFLNEEGEGIVFNVPEDLDDQVSQGLKAFTQVILNDLPDSTGFDHAKRWDWKGFRPEPPPPARRIINGNIVKVWQDVQISAKEDVRGNVVVIFGNAQVAGRVDGAVVTVFGNLLLDDGAEVTGSVVTAGGYLDQDPGATVDDVVAIDPLNRGRGEGWQGLFRHDGLTFLISQGLFLLTLLLAVVAVVATPRRRFEVVVGALTGAPSASFGLGVLVALGGHVVVAVLMAVLIITVIGLPLALLVAVVLAIAAVLAVAVVGAVLGDLICRRLGGRCHAPWLVVVVGMTALHVVSFVGSLLGLIGSPETLASLVVVLGMTIKIAAYVFGLGALVHSRFGLRPTGA
ncbi:hypothetical protein KDM41_00090 [bacterium]|nr:hypothetical protein [bacterium]